MKKNEVPDIVSAEFSKHDWALSTVGTGQPLTFGHFADLYNFVEKERNFWNSQTRSALNQVRNHWGNCFNYLTYAYENGEKQGNLSQHLGHAYSHVKTNGWPNIISDSAIAQKILSLPENQSDQRVQAFLYSAIERYPQPQNFRIDMPQVLSGMIEGLAFREPGVFSDFLKVADSELAKNFDNRLKETESLKQNYSTLEKSLQDTFAENKEAVEKWRTEKIAALDTDLKEVRKRYTELEHLYSEKLKLEAPARYWQKRASRMRWVGFGWLAASIACVLFGGWLLWHYFVAPGVFIDPKDLANQAALATVKEPTAAFFASAKNIRALIGFSVIVSLSFFLLRMLIKLTVSAFHLSIDAAEREQLTYLYLSLIDKSQKDGKDIIAGEDRQIILRSLFSRADTGLLAGDSSPTMPGADIVAAVKGGGK